MFQTTPEILEASKYVLLGLVELGNRNYKNAEAQFNQALQEFPEFHTAILGRTLASTMRLHVVPLDESEVMLKQIVSDLEHILANSKRMLKNITSITKQS